MTTRVKKEKIEFNEAVHGARLKELITQASGLRFQVESANDAIKDLRTLAKDELGLTPKQFNAVLRIHHKGERNKVEAENDEILGVYDAVFNKRSS